MPYRDVEKRRAYAREWIRRNPQKAREAMRRWRKRHPDEHRAETRSYYERHREALAAYFAQYRRTHREVRQSIGARRRARERGAEGSYTTAEWQALVRLWQGCCAYCGQRAPLQPDHRVPLARGGTNSIDNILPACSTCNMRKYASSEQEFRERLARERGRQP